MLVRWSLLVGRESLRADYSTVFENVDLDGDIDLVCHFRTQDLQLTSSSTEATLTGETAAGVPITGTRNEECKRYQTLII